MIYFNDLTNRLNMLNSIDSIRKLKLINFKKSKYSNFSKFDYIKEDITKFDENLAPKKWYTQFYMGCILFSLVNSGIINNVLNDFEYNRDRNLKHDLSDIEHIKYELKAIDVWKKLTKYNVLDNKIRSEIESNIAKINSFKEFVPIMQLLKKNEKHFFNNEIDSIKKLCRSIDVTLSNNTEFEQKIEYIKRLPYGSLISYNEHWSVFLGIEGTNLIICNPLLSNKFERVSINLVPFIDRVIIKGES